MAPNGQGEPGRKAREPTWSGVGRVGQEPEGQVPTKSPGHGALVLLVGGASEDTDHLAGADTAKPAAKDTFGKPSGCRTWAHRRGKSPGGSRLSPLCWGRCGRIYMCLATGQPG